jgi:uncharacterized protein with PQ loop repeat
MPRAKFYGFFAIVVSLILGVLFFYFAFFNDVDFNNDSYLINNSSFYIISIPIGLVSLMFLGTGFWVGWTILTIKVAPPMPEIVERKDYARIKALLLCLITLALTGFFIYGIFVRSYLALAIPATLITLVILGMVFWVGVAIISTRSTLPDNKKK